jgi:hypothetical protein
MRKEWTLECGCVVAGAKSVMGFRDDTPKRLIKTCARHSERYMNTNFPMADASCEKCRGLGFWSEAPGGVTHPGQQHVCECVKKVL